MKKEENPEDEFWSEGSFIQSIGNEDMERKKDTFHKSHSEDMKFNCKKCNKKISAHNRDWHDCICDDCFNKTYFPNEDE